MRCAFCLTKSFHDADAPFVEVFFVFCNEGIAAFTPLMEVLT